MPRIGTPQVNITMDDDLRARIQQYADAKGRTFTNACRWLMIVGLGDEDVFDTAGRKKKVQPPRRSRLALEVK